MSADWKPGDVALVTFDNASMVMREKGQTDVTTLIGLRREDDWALPSYGCSIGDSEVTDACPLVVIDPEDREQVERVVRSFWDAQSLDHGASSDFAYMQDALRSLIEPPKPEEPTGLGAVVEDAEGRRWTRVELASNEQTRNPWYPAEDADAQPAEFSDIAAVCVLAEGVQS